MFIERGLEQNSYETSLHYDLSMKHIILHSGVVMQITRELKIKKDP